MHCENLKQDVAPGMGTTQTKQWWHLLTLEVSVTFDIQMVARVAACGHALYTSRADTVFITSDGSDNLTRSFHLMSAGADCL